METSLSVQNDAIFKKAKWWIVSSLVLSLVSYCWICFCMPILENYYLWAELGPDNIFYIIHGIVGYVSRVLFIVGCVVLLKHSVSSIRTFAKMLIINESVVILAMVLNVCVWPVVLSNIYENGPIQSAWRTVISYSTWLITSFIFLMGLAALWKNKQIRANYSTIISFFAILTFISYLLGLSSNMWVAKDAFANPMLEFGDFYYTLDWEINSMLAALDGFLFPIVRILFIYCYCKLLKTPSLMPTEDNPDELPYSYCPTKIEIGFVICVALFIGCIFLTFQFV